MSEFDTGYSVVIGKPVVHAEKKATGSSVSFPCEAIPDGSYLVSLEVNGSVKAYRESLDFSSGSCTVGEYTLSYSSYALTVSGVSNNDIVRVMVEPLEVKTTDAFRAAVKKDAPETPNELPAVAAADKNKFLHTNESTGALEWAEAGGGRFVVTFSYDVGTETWSADKTIAECVAAWNAGQTLFAYNSNLAIYNPMSSYNSEDTYMEFVTVDGETGTVYGFGIDADGVYQYGGR